MTQNQLEQNWSGAHQHIHPICHHRGSLREATIKACGPSRWVHEAEAKDWQTVVHHIADLSTNFTYHRAYQWFGPVLSEWLLWTQSSKLQHTYRKECSGSENGWVLVEAATEEREESKGGQTCAHEGRAHGQVHILQVQSTTRRFDPSDQLPGSWRARNTEQRRLCEVSLITVQM